MKKIYLALLALTLGVSAQAQRNLTLNTEILVPTFNQNITTGSSVNFSYKITNNSATTADSLQKGDTIKFFDPASKYDLATSKFLTYTGSVTLTSSITKGSTLTITTSTPLIFANILTLADPADGLKYKVGPFTNNKQYAWFFSLYQITIPSTNIPLGPTSSATADTALVWINKKPTFIAEEKADINEFVFTYPNPAVNQVSFKHNFNEMENAKVSILDVTGRTVFTQDYNNNIGSKTFDINTTSLNTGAYILHLIVGDKTMVNKFNVQK